jgi:hypothetical protein
VAYPCGCGITALPEAAELAAWQWKAKSNLTGALALSGAEGGGDSLLETLNDRGRAAAAGLAEKQVDMFGHEHVANKSKAVTHARLFEGADGKIAGAKGVQERPSPVAAEGDEMQIAKPGDALKIFRHGGEEGPTLSKTERVGHPGGGVYYLLPTTGKYLPT